VFISNPGTGSQLVSSLQLGVGVLVDDTVFAGAADKTLLVADKTTNDVYAITGSFGFNTGYSAAQDASLNGFVGALNPNGTFAQIVTGLGNPAGEAFLGVPEPWSIFLLGSGVLLLIGLRWNTRGHRTTTWKLVKADMRKAGIAENLCKPKARRHTFAVKAGQSGIPLDIVQRWLDGLESKRRQFMRVRLGTRSGISHAVP
jgi:hypothetical protein